MDMWVSHAQRRGSCILCTHLIEPGNEVMVGQRKWTHSGGTRTKRTYSHYSCWKTNADTYLLDNPYTPTVKAGPGRPTKYTAEQAKERMRLSISIARWSSKQKEYVGDGMWAMANKYGGMIKEYRYRLVNM